eukprot:Platyproteum_vivax@DN1975_c0_g1_i1.p1
MNLSPHIIGLRSWISTRVEPQAEARNNVESPVEGDDSDEESGALPQCILCVLGCVLGPCFWWLAACLYWKTSRHTPTSQFLGRFNVFLSGCSILAFYLYLTSPVESPIINTHSTLAPKPDTTAFKGHQGSLMVNKIETSLVYWNFNSIDYFSESLEEALRWVNVETSNSFKFKRTQLEYEDNVSTQFWLGPSFPNLKNEPNHSKMVCASPKFQVANSAIRVAVHFPWGGSWSPPIIVDESAVKKTVILNDTNTAWHMTPQDFWADAKLKVSPVGFVGGVMQCESKPAAKDLLVTFARSKAGLEYEVVSFVTHQLEQFNQFEWECQFLIIDNKAGQAGVIGWIAMSHIQVELF